MLAVEVINTLKWCAIYFNLIAIGYFALVGVIHVIGERYSKNQVKVISEQLLNKYTNEACYFEDGTIRCHNIDNVLTHIHHGFPIGIDINFPGVYFLYEGVFNELPEKWIDFEEIDEYEYDDFELHCVTPWLKSMGFSEITWHGDSQRYACMMLGVAQYNFIYN